MRLRSRPSFACLQSLYLFPLHHSHPACPKQEETSTDFFLTHPNVSVMAMVLGSCTPFCSSQHPFIPIVPGSSKEVFYFLMHHLPPQGIYIANRCHSLHFTLSFSGGLFKIVLHGLPPAPFEVVMGYVSV